MEGKLKLLQLVRLLRGLSHERKADWVQKKREISKNDIVCVRNKPFLYLERQRASKIEALLIEAPATRQGEASSMGLPGVARGRGAWRKLEIIMTNSAMTKLP